MTMVKNGDKVSIHFTGKKQDDTLIGTSKGGTPVELVVGEKTVIPGLEKELIGMQVGAEKTVVLAPEEAFGLRREEFVLDIRRSEFPDEITPEIGKTLSVESADGTKVSARIIEIAEDTVTLDANHPLAGETVRFDIEVVDISG